MLEPTITTKKPVSEKQLQANRLNARKSTGPRTIAGKLASRFGNLQHGCRAEVPVLPGEDEEEYSRRLSAWTECLGATDEAQRYEVKRAVRASWKMDRADTVEEGMVADLMDEVADSADDAEMAETERLAATLSENPGVVVRQLRKTPSGCRWILAKLSIFADRLDAFLGLLNTEFDLVLLLLGKRLSDVFAGDPIATRWVVAQLSGVFGTPDVDLNRLSAHLGGRPDGMCPSEYSIRLKLLASALVGKEEGRALLRAYIAEIKAELTEHLALVDELTEYKRARSVSNARVALTPEGKQLLQYQKKHEGSHDAALRRLDALQNPRKPRTGPAPKPKKENVAETTKETQSPITTETQATVTNADDGQDCHATGAPMASTTATTPEPETEVGEKTTEAIFGGSTTTEVSEKTTEAIFGGSTRPAVSEKTTKAIFGGSTESRLTSATTETLPGGIAARNAHRAVHARSPADPFLLELRNKIDAFVDGSGGEEGTYSAMKRRVGRPDRGAIG